MGLTAQQLATAGVAAGLWTEGEIAAEVQAWLAALPAGEQTKDGETFATALLQRDKLSRFQADELLSGSSTPLVLGDYVLQARIGAGGMGQVFKARHRRMKRFAAIKLLPPALTKDEAAVKRFEREVEAAAKLSHPNIVQTHDAGVQRDVWYLVMEYVDGRDLSAVVAAEGPLPIARAVDHIRQAAKGLAYAHRCGVVHRDIKPANLLLDQEGTVKILDMGLARFEDAAAAKEGLTESGQVMGTVDYMAPEQAFDVRTADGRADIYSLGCTLYRLLTGRNMYDAESLVQKLMAHQSRPIPPLGTHRPDVPKPLVAIFERMVAKQPQERFQTMAEVEAALATFAGANTAASSTSKPEPDSKLTSFFRAMTGSKPAASPAASVPAPTLGNSPLTNPESPAAADVAPTVNLNNPQQATDPVSERSIQVARTNTPAPRSAKRPAWWQNRVTFTAAGIATLLLLACGIWGIIRVNSGNEIPQIPVPKRGTATTETGRPGPSSTPAEGSVAIDCALKFANELTTTKDFVTIPSVHYTLGEPLTLEGYFSVGPPDDVTGYAAGHLLELDGARINIKTEPSDMLNRTIVKAFAMTPMAYKATAHEYVTARSHFALVLEPEVMHLFVNGKMRTCPIPPDVRIPAEMKNGIVLGRRHASGWGFGGTLDELRISKTARYLQDFVPEPRFNADNDTLALYHFDEGQGDVLVDSSGHGHHGKIVGAKWVKADGSAIVGTPKATTSAATTPPIASD